MNGRLSVLLLGTVQVHVNGQPAPSLGYDKARSLLAFLAIERNNPHRRDELTDLFWPEQPRKEARHSLSQALLTCRKALGDLHQDTPTLLINRHTIQWNPNAPVELDVAQFETLLAACTDHAHSRKHTCKTCMDRRREAVARYRGDLLGGLHLDGCPAFDDWIVVRREKYRRLAVDALVALADYHERRGEITRAREHTERQIELEPWREEAHRQLMRLLLVRGQRSAALAQYQVCAGILASELGVEPSTRTQALYEEIKASRPVSPHNLSLPLTPLFGRQTELADLMGMLADPGCRLITLWGSSGIGKSRLALALAEQTIAQAVVGLHDRRQRYVHLRHGVYFVPLASVHRATDIAPAILRALNLPADSRSFSGDSTHQSAHRYLLGHLREKQLLLILDNFEQLLAQDEAEMATALVLTLIQAAPEIKLLVTSQERLLLSGEHVVPVHGLARPTGQWSNDRPEDSLLDYSAVALFQHTARQARPDFLCAGETAVHVATICRMLQGMPLAIELAAGALHDHSLEEIARELSNGLDILSTRRRHVPDRHRSMQAAFEKGWRRLSIRERELFRQLSLFQGGFTRKEARTAAGADRSHLDSLVDKSFVRYRRRTKRYEIHNLLRQFGAEQKTIRDPVV